MKGFLANLTKIVLFGNVVTLVMLLSSCDYFGSFSFQINNKTNNYVLVTYLSQGKTYQHNREKYYESVFPRKDDEDNFDLISSSEKETIIRIHPNQSIQFVFDIGQVNRDFPEEDDIPEMYGVVPLWERITHIVVGEDSISSSYFSKDSWQRVGSHYILNIYNH